MNAGFRRREAVRTTAQQLRRRDREGGDDDDGKEDDGRVVKLWDIGITAVVVVVVARGGGGGEGRRSADASGGAGGEGGEDVPFFVDYRDPSTGEERNRNTLTPSQNPSAVRYSNLSTPRGAHSGRNRMRNLSVALLWYGTHCSS